MIRRWMGSAKPQDPLIQQYRQYRELGKELASTILETFADATSLRTVGRLLGVTQGKTFVIDSEAEVELLMDFSLHEYLVDGRNFIQRYLDSKPVLEPEVRTVLEAKSRSYTSLFRISATEPSRSRVQLLDLLNQNHQVEIIDINLSQTASVGALLFTRIVPFLELNMTSGVYCIFVGHSEKEILSRIKILMKRVKSDVESIKRFVAFFKLNRTHGLEVQTVDI